MLRMHDTSPESGDVARSADVAVDADTMAVWGGKLVMITWLHLHWGP
jgi:hypothetical protein